MSSQSESHAMLQPARADADPGHSGVQTRKDELNRSRDQRADAAALLLLGMELAVYERSSEGEFEVVNQLPGWLVRLTSSGTAAFPETGSVEEKGARLTEHFPALEAFLPVADDFWATGSAERLKSDFWTETDAEGVEYHLLAYALTSGTRHFLVIERADATYIEHQQLQLYAHEMVVQYETITRLNQEVERATRAKSDFLATMSHEIRTPLNAILGMADLLADSGLNAEQAKYVEVFQRAGGNLLGLINDILDLSKVEAGHLELEAVEFELADVVGRALELTRVKAAKKGLEVGSALGAGLPRLLVGDPLRLRQVLLNLLGNAMKFTDAGSLQVEVRQDPEDSTPGALLFGVRDTGIGIPEDKLGTIFENFSQADTSTTRKYGGTGLGLAISKRLVELMSGRIWVESVVGEGSTFLFTAKLGVSQRVVEEKAAVPVEAGADAGLDLSGGMPSAERKTLHILLADDSDDNRFLIGEYLKNTECVLELAENGEIALGKMKAGHFDLVLMDAHMPVMDGYTATLAMREWERSLGRTAIPILALTADAFQESVQQSVLAGFNAHLTKPISKVTLMRAIGRHALVCTRPSRKPAPVLDPAIAHLAPRYLKNVAKDLNRLRMAQETEDYATIQRIGHNLHGTGGSFGFPHITDIGAAMEQAAKDLAMDRIGATIRDLSSYMEEIQTPH